MNINRYIFLSFFSHLLFIGILGITHAPVISYPTIFDVKIVKPPVTQTPPAKKKYTPPVIKKNPIIIKRRRKPPDKNLLPENIHGKGTGSITKGEKNIDASGSEKETQKSLSQKHNVVPLLPEKDRSDDSASRKDEPYLAPPSLLFDKKTIEKFAGKGSPEKKGLTFDAPEFKHRGYMRMLKEKIESVWKYPREAARLGLSGDLYINFTIKRNGKLSDIELIRTSGYHELDMAAIQALKDAEPYWPLPEGYKKETLEIKGHFIYIFGTTYVM